MSAYQQISSTKIWTISKIPQMTTEITRTIRIITSTIKALTPQMMSKISWMTIEITRTIRAVTSPIGAPSLWMISEISCMTTRMISQPPGIKNASTMVCKKWKGGVVEGRKTDEIKVFFNFLFEASCG